MRIAFFGDSLTRGVPGCSYFALLGERLPGHTLVNYGVGNDTVVSLYRRVARMRFAEPFDVAVLLVGVNDVGDGSSSWSFRLVNALERKPAARSLEEFRKYYRKTLGVLRRAAPRVVAVSPLLKGEDVANAYNRELAAICRLIEEEATRSGTEYLDLRSVFVRWLAGKRISG